MNPLKRTLDTIFVLGLLSFMLLGSAIVLLQALGIASNNGDLAIRTKEALSKPACILASITGLCGFLMGYVHRSKSEES
jgi:hypothetical protein